MRWILIILAVVVAGAVAFWQFKPGAIAVDVAKPETPVTDSISTAPQRTRIALPISIRMDALEAVINLAPRQEKGVVDNPVDAKELVDDNLRWQIDRKRIFATAEGSALRLTTVLDGKARLSGKLNLGGGDLGKLLGKLTKAAPIRATADLGAKVDVTTTPRLMPNWTIAPEMTVDLKLTKAELPVKGIGSINIRNHVQPALGRAVALAVEQAEGLLANPDVMRGPLQKTWQELCAAWPVQSGLWLTTRPIALRAAQPVITPERVLIAAEVEADMTLVTSDAPPQPQDCAPLPRTLEIIAIPSIGDAEIALPVRIGWEWLTDAIDEAVKAPVEVSGYGMIAVSEPSVSAFGDLLLIGAMLDSAPSAFYLPSIRGRVWVTARPQLDRNAGVLRLTDVALTTETANALSGAAGWAADAMLSYWKNRDISVDIAELEAEALEVASQQARSLTEGLATHGRFTVSLDEIRLADIAVAGDGLAADVRAKGRIAAEDVRLLLNR